MVRRSAFGAGALALVLMTGGCSSGAPGEAAQVDPQPGSSAAASPEQPVRLVGFGDSVMAGTGCDCEDFLARSAALVEEQTGRAVTDVNNSANGETAAGLLRDLRSDDAERSEVADGDLIVLTIGANDLADARERWEEGDCDAECSEADLTQMGQDVADLLALINRTRRSDSEVLVTTYWNVFQDGRVGREENGEGFPAWSDALTRRANSILCAEAEKAGATCVDLYQPFKGDGSVDPTHLLADDGDHPSEAGAALIAEAVAAAAADALS